MKITSIIRNVLLATVALVAVAATTPVQAYDHDKSGYFDEHHHHHPYSYHNHHRGYWDNRGGNKVFITI